MLPASQPGTAVSERSTAPQTSADGRVYPGDTHQLYIPDAKNVGGTIGNSGLKEWVMQNKIGLLTEDMSRFAFILRVMGLSDLAQKYEQLAGKLRNDQSREAVKEARGWVASSFGRGSSSLGDRYVYRDGVIDEALNAEYETLLQKLTDFANGA